MKTHSRSRAGLRIVHVVDRADDEAGGTVTALRGIHATLAAAFPSAEQLLIAEDRPARRYQRIANIAHTLVTDPVPIRTRRIRAQAGASAVIEADVVIAHCYWSRMAKMASEFGVPMALMPHGSLVDNDVRGSRPLAKDIARRTVLRGVLPRTSNVWVASSWERDALAPWVPRSKIHVLPIPISLSGVEPSSDKRREGELLFIGRLAPVKNLESLIRALALLPSRYTLTVAGDGDAGYARKLKGLAVGLAVTHRIRWLGWTDSGLIRSLLERSAALIVPSHWENYGLVVAEGLKAGIPVIASDQVGLARDLPKAEYPRLVEPTPNNLAEAVLAIDASGRPSGAEYPQTSALADLTVDALAHRYRSAVSHMVGDP